jgi:hypothetical protein
MSESARWDRLFAELEAQAEAEARLDLEGEVAERTRIARAEVGLDDRVQAQLGRRLAVRTVGGGRVEGVLAGAGQGWLLLGSAPVLVLTTALSTIAGLDRGHVVAPAAGRLPRASVRGVLRALSRDRSPVRLRLVGGEEISGTLDLVGRDHVDVAEHPWDEPRRSPAVRAVRTIPFSALALVHPAPGTSSLAW